MSALVPKLSLTPVKFNRLESLTEGAVSTHRLTETDRPSDEKSPKKKKSKKRLSRRDSMMNALRDELKNMESLPALKTHRPPSVMDEWMNTEEEKDEDAYLTDRGTQRRRFSSVGDDFMRGNLSTRRSISGGSEDIIVSGYELKKIRMLQSLESMGVTLPRKRIQSSDEREILQSMEFAKRQSLSTRLLQTVNKKPRFRHRSRSRSREATVRSSPEEASTGTDDESRDKLDNMLHAITKKVVDPKNPVVFGNTGLNFMKNDLGNDVIGTFRRKIRRRKVRPYIKWKRLSKFIVILLRAWKIHSQSVNSILGLFESLDALTNSYETKDLMFNVTDFKAGKEGMISSEVRRILEKKPKTRTLEEIHYVQIALRNYKSIAEYPVDMQKKIASRGWYETYDAKRVIVREGHLPICFYFVLTGSAVVSFLDVQSNANKTVLFLHRGDSFGEQAIMTRTLRQTTVISREKIELLVMSDEDFIDIFMSGGLRDVNDPFIKSLKFLEEWPVEKLADNPKKAIFSFFKRGKVLIKDTSQSDWIFVVKSGSCSLLKRLQLIDPTKRPRKSRKKEWREKVEECLKIGATLSHEDQVTLLFDEEVKKLEQQNVTLRYYALPEINIATNEAYNDLRQLHDEMIENNFIKRTIEDLKQRAANEGSIITETDLELDEEEKINQEARKYRRMSLVDLTNLVSKGPFMTKPKKTDTSKSATTVRTTTEMTVTVEDETINDYTLTGGDVTQERMSNHPPSSKADEPSTIENDGGDYVFVNCHTLTKGQIFGLQDICFENQPSFSLVSNGVEVIMIHKKFYTENMTNNQLVRLREHVWPYPSSEELQATLDSHIRWDYHKKLNMKKSLRDVRMRNLPPSDSRAHLNVPKVGKENSY
ncbi:uncharacterized protein LOC134274962 [Saccostrea cucullata]|uniref:uncharacterized protein LOC134274962 n=1 Tax=Saccostrea cuccullata TaxID=36930 RepID=UPI002ED62232